MSFGFWDNEALTAAHSGEIELFHRTDLSDNPQDGVIYFGSTDEDLVVYAASDPGNDDIIISITDNTNAWEAETAYTVGDRVEPTTANDYIYECTVGGTSDTDEPDWPEPPDGYGTTVVDGTVTWALKKPKNKTDEVIIATSSEDLDTNTPGGSLNLGTSIDGGVDNKVAIHYRVSNAVTITSNTVGNPEITLTINDVDEYEAV